MDRGIGRWVGERAFLSGDAVAFIEEERSVTFGEFDESTSRLARALLSLGVRRGDRVGVLLFNSVEFMETFFACAKLGAICVPVNFRLSAAEVGYILVDAGVDVFVYHQPLADLARGALVTDGVRVRHRVLVGGTPTAGEVAYHEVMRSGEPRPLNMDIEPHEVCAIMYTSGTTGRPKGVMITHANADAQVHNTFTIGRGLREGDVTITSAPMFHIGGLGVHTLPLVYLGGTTVIHRSFDPARTLADMADKRATVQFLVPSMWAALMRMPDFESYDLSALELAVAGGEPTPLPVIEFFQDRGVPFQEGFGMTEASPSVSVLGAAHVKAKLGSIGRALPEVEVRIVDPDDREVAPGTVGELLLRGRNIFLGYWMLPAETADAFRNGWFHTGDLGRVDEEGFITLVDRKKDMVISGGENVYPIEAEQVLVLHPAVREVAVFGVPHPRWGETVVAAAALTAGTTASPDELIAFCRERLAHFKCPTRIEVLDELPRNATGKVLKRELRVTYGGTAASVSR
ncbi:acyl-CoA synthetase [Rhodococcoides fascians]|uniref:acyl-CoA synthetase n=1 Tax=Rhodococcoides fascians TaxID=1828 RepID=UPI00055CEAA4|nr:long-chain fatty acid--CoA ligase [Rhodococcus fascians]